MTEAIAAFMVIVGFFFSMAGCLMLAIQAVKVVWLMILSAVREIQEFSNARKLQPPSREIGGEHP